MNISTYTADPTNGVLHEVIGMHEGLPILPRIEKSYYARGFVKYIPDYAGDLEIWGLPMPERRFGPDRGWSVIR